MSDFSFLSSPLRKQRSDGSISISENNVFFPVNLSEIKEAEKKLRYAFPSELRDFYQQIGYGYLTTPHNPPPGYTFLSANEILPPLTVAHFALGEREWEGQDHWMSEEFIEYIFQPGDLPFFELQDSNAFLTMQPLSENPNAVYMHHDIKLEDSFERFIWRLYYEDPRYFDDIVTQHYAKLKN